MRTEIISNSARGESKVLQLALTPRGHLTLAPAPEGGFPLERELADRLAEAFAHGDGQGLLQLVRELDAALPPELSYWRGLGARYLSARCARPDLAGEETPVIAAPDEAELQALAQAAPPMLGIEYLSATVLVAFWRDLDEAFTAELAASGAPLLEFVRSFGSGWNLVGRVHFNLALNRKSEEAPFAFLATYTHQLSSQGQAQHLPLGQALREYAGAANRERLLSLLLPVQRAAETCDWLREMVDAGEIFHPLRWSATDALRLLEDAPKLERAGLILRMPASWQGRRPPRPTASVSLGAKPPSLLGLDALLDFELEVTLEGEPLTQAEIRRLLASTEGLALVRGQWVEIDRERLGRSLERLRRLEREVQGGLGLAGALRLLAGAEIGDAERLDADWARFTAGPWLARMLSDLRGPEGLARVSPGAALNGTLRPYQELGVRWLYLLTRLGLGACLADDMGLGKTIQVLALLLVRKEEAPRTKKSGRRPSLLVAPASLLGNWTSEIARFAPSLEILVAHASVMPAAELKALPARRLTGTDLVLTTYGSLSRLPWLAKTAWDLVLLDEAQAIKNPAARQTRAAKALSAHSRIVLTGTPIENRLGDLWSLFDFTHPGLLGSSQEFSQYSKRLGERSGGYGSLRELVRPYILRRLKTDRNVVSDLPEKTEVKAYCALSRRQAALYQQAVQELARKLETADGIERRGLVLTSLMRLKQICNHPSQWLGDNAWDEGGSGKFQTLREIVEVIAARQEKVLVFSQYREILAPLGSFLESLFGRAGLTLHGGTAVKKRRDLVERFQEDEAVPFFLLSLKAGGSGLNLTAASHVIHFDRWWNPAVENQATDRAFRIGQRKNVLVHKLVCRGTVEERIDTLIESKRGLARDLLEGGQELPLTELSNEELLQLVRLDLKTALEES